jgi:hypothetical protein
MSVRDAGTKNLNMPLVAPDIALLDRHLAAGRGGEVHEPR